MAAEDLASGGIRYRRVWHYGTGFIGALQLQKLSGVFTIKRQFITIPVDTDLSLRNISELQVADPDFSSFGSSGNAN